VNFRYSKRALQCAVALGGFVPVLAGLAGVVAGLAMIDDFQNVPISLDSHYRYLSGLLLGIGLLFWATIPDIEKKEKQFRLLTCIVVIGGSGRLWSLLTMGIPDKSMLFGLVMELVVTPLLAFWQYRLAKRSVLSGTK
jgi:hypothetical protein